MGYKLLFLDMDGTTLDENKKIPPDTIEAIKELSKRGVRTVVATGRGLAELHDYEDTLDFIHYGVVISGGMVYDFRRAAPLFKVPLKIADTLKLIAVAREAKSMLHVLTVKESFALGSDIDHMENFQMKIYQEMYERVCIRVEDYAAMEDYVQAHPDDIMKINIYSRSLPAREWCYEQLKGRDLTLVFAEGTGVEASPSGITKASGLHFLCQHLNIDEQATIAIGDADNDKEIIKAAGLGIAMGNAKDDVKSIADAVTLPNTENGVLAAINKYLL